MKYVQFILMAFTVLSCFLSGCASNIKVENDIVLDGFSEANFIALDRALGTQTCITGELLVGPDGVYYLLHPYETDDVLWTAPSRVNSDKSFTYAYRKGLQDGQTYKTCGMLRDTKLFPNCTAIHCRWYELEQSRIHLPSK